MRHAALGGLALGEQFLEDEPKDTRARQYEGMLQAVGTGMRLVLDTGQIQVPLIKYVSAIAQVARDDDAGVQRGEIEHDNGCVVEAIDGIEDFGTLVTLAEGVDILLRRIVDHVALAVSEADNLVERLDLLPAEDELVHGGVRDAAHTHHGG